MKKYQGDHLGQSIIFTGDEVRPCSIWNFGVLNYHLSTKYYGNVEHTCQVRQGWLTQRQWAEHFCSAKMTLGALGHVKRTA